MRLFLLRHAQAADTWPDADRVLTPKGRAQVEKLCRALDPKPFADTVQIWHSPFARALETAELFKAGMRLPAPLLEVGSITPEDNPAGIARTIASLACFGGDLMVVSHNPLLENLAALLLKSAFGSVYFRKCTLASLSLIEEPSIACEYGMWSLDFIAPPSMLA